MSIALIHALFHTVPATCHRCGEPTFARDLRRADELTAEVIALLGISERTGHACRGCVDGAERELDDAAEALALDNDPAFAEVCDARDASYRAHAMAHQGELVAMSVAA